MWSTLHGEPVIGPLVGKGIKLKRRSVVTTTWGEWLKRHPKTTVLSLKTGHRRDYREGVAYKDYFESDFVMFYTPFQDKRLPNKREVLALRTDDPASAVAIDTNFLKGHPVYQLKVAGDSVLVLTTAGGESRAYQTNGQIFKSWDQKETAIDEKGQLWKLDEESLQKVDSPVSFPRYPSHQSFWFGWLAQFPETKLIK